jgi:tetratricopeptide (TPR) repeat protein
MTAGSRPASNPAADDARYQIERKLGAGSAGAVYLVRDRETGEQLALKKLFRVDAKSVLRLKREFRSLQAVSHPHIIKLYDMGQAADSWFLTMEYLDGVDLTTYLGNAAAGSSAEAANSAHDQARVCLLTAFRQLALGIHALHRAGMLHRDLKPSNVLVVGARVVLLDFGLVRELSQGAATLTEDGAVAGTPAYMAPEQIMAAELTAASDWYAFGAMLYEAVSGVLPMNGPLLQLMRAKLESDPVRLDERVPGVPAWLNHLCMALLQREPALRPHGDAVLAAFDAAIPDLRAQTPATVTESVVHTEKYGQEVPNTLYGRADETRQLWSALSETERGGAVIVHVRAASGAGKSALVESFLNEVEHSASGQAGAALVLRSRCHELEAMPFKALDGVIDALVGHLSGLDDFAAAHMLPGDVNALARVFPVLGRLNAVKRLLAAGPPAQDALQTRRRAETALSALLDNLAVGAPVIVWIDDLQWGDLDSARILKNWISQPSAASILFVFSYRSDEMATSLCLRHLLEADGVAASTQHTLDLPCLRPSAIQALCEPHLDAAIPARSELIARVVREAQGSPFLASQLIALAEAKSARGDADTCEISLDLMVAQTGAMLQEDAQLLLALLAIAGRPMSPKIALKAVGVSKGGRSLVHDLRSLNLVRTRDVSGQRMLEVYHDRVRERVQRSLSAQHSTQLHARLFDTLEFSGHAEPDWLHRLALGAGYTTKALAYGDAAAARANASLAFEQAVSMYRQCLELVPAAESGELWGKLALALARSGRGIEAAEACLQAASHVAHGERVGWILRAASHFIRSGHYARGEELVHKVLAAHKISVPSGDAGLIAAIVWERACTRWLGSHDVVRAEPEVSADLLERFDVLYELSVCTQIYDPLRGALFQARSLRCALQAGEPTRMSLALRNASVAVALSGSSRAAREADALVARAEAINAQRAQTDAHSTDAVRAVNAFVLGRLHEVLEPAAHAERLFRQDSQDDPTGNYHMRFLVRSVRAGALHYCGRYAEFVGELQTLLDEAAAIDNRAVLLQMTYSETLAEQITGRAARSRARLDKQRKELPDNCFGVVHVLHLVAVMSDACWSGDYAPVRDYIEAAWAGFERSAVRRAAYLALMAHATRSHFLLNAYVASGRQGDARHVVQHGVRALDKLPLPAAGAAALRLRARVAFLSGQTAAAVTHLRASLSAYEGVGMLHEVARDQYALAVLEEPVRADACAAAAQRIRELGVVDVAADIKAYYPELVALGRG